jgi:hypothetical protein
LPPENSFLAGYIFQTRTTWQNGKSQTLNNSTDNLPGFLLPENSFLAEYTYETRTNWQNGKPKS